MPAPEETDNQHDAQADDTDSSRPLSIPELPPDVDILTAALAYAECGWYVLPVRRGTKKNPGSVVGDHWQDKSSRDPAQIAAWFAGTDRDIALHCGRSGAVVVDVDKPDKVPGEWAAHLDPAPCQSTRPDTPGRGHYAFAMPPGRSIGIPTRPWGEIRGLNGVIMAEPSHHKDGGEYRWLRTGPVSVLPPEIADDFADTSPGEDAATDEHVDAFLKQYICEAQTEALQGLTKVLRNRFDAGESRHMSAVSVTAGAMKEARLGLYPAQAAVDVIRAMFLAAVAQEPVSGKQGAARSGGVVESEWRGILPWAVGQALAANLDETRARVEDKMFDNQAWMDNIASHTTGQESDNNDGDLADGAADIAPVALTRLADVKPEQISWLWPGYVPLGKLVTLDGDPGLGKSTLSLSIATPVTGAGPWPDGTTCEHQGAVLIMSAEDGLADTIRPRLDAAGADVTRVHAIQGVPIDNEGTLRPPTIADIAALEIAIKRTGARLLLIDVLMAYLPAGTDSHKDQDIRRTLSRLTALADRTGCTILLIRHLNKTSGRDPIYRGGGSIGIVGAARAGLLVASDPDDPERRVLASIKSNLGPAPESLTYRLVDAAEHGCARVQWEGQTIHDAHTLLADRTDDEEVDERDDPDDDLKESWLYKYLQDAHKAKAEIRPKDAVAVGADKNISRASVFRLFGKLANAGMVKSVDGEGFPRVTYWRLADETTDPDTQAGETTETTGADQAKQDETTAPLRGNSETTGETASDQAKQVNDAPVVSVVSPETHDAPAPGGITDDTPGNTSRVQQALAKVRNGQTATEHGDA